MKHRAVGIRHKSKHNRNGLPLYELQLHVLPVVGSEVDADGGPVFPQNVIVGIPSEGSIGDEVGGSTLGVNHIVVLVEDTHGESGLIFRRMVGVL